MSEQVHARIHKVQLGAIGAQAQAPHVVSRLEYRHHLSCNVKKNGMRTEKCKRENDEP
jgi:hypothetical protein